MGTGWWWPDTAAPSPSSTAVLAMAVQHMELQEEEVRELLGVPGVCLWCRRFAASKGRTGGRLKSERLGWEWQWALRECRVWVGQGVSRHADSLELWLMGFKKYATVGLCKA